MDLLKWCCVLLVVVQCGCVVESGQLKVSKLRELSVKEEDGVIRLNGTGHEYFLDTQPRPYDMVVFFTTDNCQLCLELQQEFIRVSHTYVAAGAQYPPKTLKHTNNINQPRSVFFAIINYSHNTHKMFTQHGFQSVPNIVYYPYKISKLKKEQKQVFMKDYLWQISGNDGHITSSKILEWVNSKSGRGVEYKESVLRLVGVLGVVGVVVYYLLQLWLKWSTLFNSPRLWLVASVVVYVVCMAGVVSNIIHNTPFTQIDRQGNVQWYLEGRNQLGMEGFVMSLAITSAGIFLLLAIEGARNINSTNFFFALFRNNQYILFVIFVFVTEYIVSFIDQMYRIKNQYEPTFYPPPHFIKGPLIKDQGNSF